jgi:purine nucleosidase
MEFPKKEKWIVDTDPGCDDMMALIYLLKREEVEVLMISLVDGNVSLENVSINSRKILKLAGKVIPLYRGASFPIVRYFDNGESYHYTDGLGDIEEIQKFDVNDIRVEEENSVVKILEFINIFPNEINLLCLGPLTNIATAFMIDPEFHLKIKSMYVMGGSTLSKGNLIPPSEFNFAYDFIASKIVMSEFSNIVLTPWEPTADLIIRDHHIQKISHNRKTKNKILNEFLYSFASMIIKKFTADYNGTQLCDLYSVISAFNKNVVKKIYRIKCDINIDSIGMLGMLYIKERKLIKEEFKNLDLRENLECKSCHFVIDELDELRIFEEFEEVFYH